MSDEPRAETPDEEPRFSKAQKQLAGFIVVIAVVNFAYRLVYATGAAQTAALYVGVPTVLAIGLTLLPRNKSATGMLLKGSTLALLIACVVLPEGLLCLLFAVPLVALISVIVGGTIDWARRRRHREGPTLMAVSVPLLLLSLEGLAATPILKPGRGHGEHHRWRHLRRRGSRAWGNSQLRSRHVALPLGGLQPSHRRHRLGHRGRRRTQHRVHGRNARRPSSPTVRPDQ